MIEFDRVSKNFPGTKAIKEVSFAVARGECHALLGENGAGKSTLGKIVAGILRPDGGRLLLDGRPVDFHSPRDAMLAGVGIVHQELAFCPNLSVAENLCLHDLPRRRWRVDRAALRERAERALSTIGLRLDVETPLGELSIAEEQMVQIAAAVGLGAVDERVTNVTGILGEGPKDRAPDSRPGLAGCIGVNKVLVLDEPTSSLGREETERLFKLLRALRARGTTMIYVSHRLEEIFEICQRVTVLRDGSHVATAPVSEVDHDQLVRSMAGRGMIDHAPLEPCPEDAPVLLRARGFGSRGRFGPLDLTVRGGEIVGVAGLVGAGRSELLEALFGLDPAAEGELEILGLARRPRSPREALAAGVILVPEDRQRQGLVLSMNVRENLGLSLLDRLRRLAGRIDRRAEEELARRLCTALCVRTSSIEAPTGSLSGGNQQKLLFGRAFSGGARILLIDEPTRGVDVAAKQEIHELIRDQARSGAAVLVVSSDLPELLALSHRVVVLRGGAARASFDREQATAENVLRAMTGMESN